MTREETQESSPNAENKKDKQVKSAYLIALERAESLLQRSDEELKREDEKRMSERKPLSATPAGAADGEKAAEYLEHLQRLQAEFANYRKRIEREKTEFVKYATAELMSELTEVLDDFDRSLQGDHTEVVPEAYLKGIEGVHRKFGDILQRRGLERIQTIGEPFNPEVHEAAMQEATDAYPPGTICGEIRPGYTLGDRLLRAPLVKVATAAAKEESQENESNSGSTEGE